MESNTATLATELGNYETQLNGWIEQEKSAVQVINNVSHLWLDKSVELVIFRNQLVNRSVSEVLGLIDYARNFVGKPITINDVLTLSGELLKIDIAPSRLDIGRLASEWVTEGSSFASQAEFLGAKLNGFVGNAEASLTPKDVVLYGFGRIGRLAARELITQAGKGEQLRLRAIVTRSLSKDDIEKRADLLRNDSIHGPFPGTITADVENNALIINGHTVKLIAAKSPDAVDYEAHGITNALVIDNTGVFRDREGLGLHLKSKGIAQVLLTAPGKGDVPNIVHGVNHLNHPADSDTIFSAASCIINAIIPILKVVEESVGIDNGHLETIHSYTNDQNLLDNYHAKYRRGRSAALNMVITETGADSAIKKVLPVLSGKLTANSVRVPTPDVSLVILSLNLREKTTKDELNAILKKAALEGDLVEQIQYSISNELVSSDLIGNPCASIVDSPATIVSADGKRAVLYIWYDNEYGYTRQVMRLSKYLSKVVRMTYY